MSKQFSLFDDLSAPPPTPEAPVTEAPSTQASPSAEMLAATEAARALLNQDESEALATAIREHNRLYFEEAAPLIEDTLFDQLVRRLKALAPNHPVLSELGETPDSAVAVAHRRPMLSLQKAYSAEEITTWFLNSELPPGLIQAPKIDGIAASLRYDEKGLLTLALTRGDGEKGEPFTVNAEFIDDIPKHIAAGPLEVRGEIYLPLSVFRSRFAGTFANPRNTAAGAIKQKEAYKTKDYGLRFFAYSLFLEEECALPTPTTLQESLALAARLGFPVVPNELVLTKPVVDLKKLHQAAAKKSKRQVSAQEELIRAEKAVASQELLEREKANAHIDEGYEYWQVSRATIDYELDGVVYTINDLSQHALLGATAHHPRYAIAYKFQGDIGQSRIIDIEWSVSRSGAITPIALIEPVELSGAMVSRCSLHNLKILRSQGASAGATVLAMRRGGVIPHIERVLEPGPEPAVLPSACPSCGGSVELRSAALLGEESTKPTDSEVLYCQNPHQCPDAIRGSLDYWLKVVGVDGFGPKIISALVERGLVCQPADFYQLTVETLEQLERLGRKSATNLVEQVTAHRQIALGTFLEALGIEALGSVAAHKLARHIKTLEYARRLQVDDLFEISPPNANGTVTKTPLIAGFGEKSVTTIVRGLAERDAWVSALLDVGIEVTPSQEPDAPVVLDGPLSGQSFVFTGKLTEFTREQAQAKVRELGGTTPADVTAALSVLVVANDGKESSKQKKAAKLIASGNSIKLMSEREFLDLVGSV